MRISDWSSDVCSSDLGVPDELRRFGVGISELPGGNRKLIIDERPQGRLYLVMSFELPDTVIRRAELVSILLALIAIYLTPWLTYPASQPLVPPAPWLPRPAPAWSPANLDAHPTPPD